LFDPTPLPFTSIHYHPFSTLCDKQIQPTTFAKNFMHFTADDENKGYTNEKKKREVK